MFGVTGPSLCIKRTLCVGQRYVVMTKLVVVPFLKLQVKHASPIRYRYSTALHIRNNNLLNTPIISHFDLVVSQSLWTITEDSTKSPF